MMLRRLETVVSVMANVDLVSMMTNATGVNYTFQLIHCLSWERRGGGILFSKRDTSKTQIQIQKQIQTQTQTQIQIQIQIQTTMTLEIMAKQAWP